MTIMISSEKKFGSSNGKKIRRGTKRNNTDVDDESSTSKIKKISFKHRLIIENESESNGGKHHDNDAMMNNTNANENANTNAQQQTTGESIIITKATGGGV